MKTISTVKGVNKMSNRGIDKIKMFKFIGFYGLAMILAISVLSCQGKKQEGQISKNEANKIIKSLENTVWVNDGKTGFIVFLPNFKIDFIRIGFRGPTYFSTVNSGKIVYKDLFLILSFEKAIINIRDKDGNINGLFDLPINFQVIENNGKNIEKMFFLNEIFSKTSGYYYSKIDKKIMEEILNENKNISDDIAFLQILQILK
jgi:hypothetical protein